MNGRLVGFGFIILSLVIGYGWWLHLTKGVRALGHAAAVVIVSEGHDDCTISKNDRSSRREVPCREVSSHLRDDFDLGPGASVGIRAIGKVGSDTVATISSDLSGHGYKVVAIMRVGLIREPTGAR